MRARLIGSAGVVLALVSAGRPAAAEAPVADAVEHRDPDAVRTLLLAGADVNAPQPDGATALHWAAHWDDLETAVLLVGAGARANVANAYGVTPLMLACTNGGLPLVETLLDAGADPNAASPTGETPLMVAARTGRVGVVRALLARGAAPRARERVRGQTALMWAAAEGHVAVIRELLDRGADARAASDAGFTPLMFAARNGHVAVGDVLVESGVDVNRATPDGYTPLVVSVVRAQTAFTRFLLQHGADPNVGPGFTPLHWAAGNDWGGRVLAEDTEWSALTGLRGQPKLDVVTLLLDHGADPNARTTAYPDRAFAATRASGGQAGSAGDSATPFLFAARVADAAVMRLLLARGADPTIPSGRGVTPLMMAAGAEEWMRDLQSIDPIPERAALEAVEVCLAQGADVNAVDASGNTALHGAAWRAAKGGDAIVERLLEYGADIDAANDQGQTALFIVEDGIRTSTTLTRSPSTAALLKAWGAAPLSR